MQQDDKKIDDMQSDMQEHVDASRDDFDSAQSTHTDSVVDEESTKERASIDELSEEELERAALEAGERAAKEDLQLKIKKLEERTDTLTSELSSAHEALDKAQAQIKGAQEQYGRLQADWDNFRKRTATEREQERTRAAEKLVVNLLPVLDDMERACDHASTIADKDENFTNFIAGVEAVHEKMLGILAKEDVEVMNPAGEAFDPMIHEAVGQVSNPDIYAETVVDVYRKGYRMAGKVIRSAMVTVSAGGAKRPQETADQPSKTDQGDQA